jgi:hypothetical protein
MKKIKLKRVLETLSDLRVMPNDNGSMRLRSCLLLFFIITGIYQAYSQQSSIIFTSDDDFKFIIYKPIDGFYNEFYPTDTVILHSGSEFVYRLLVDEWCVVKCVSQSKIHPDIFIEKDSAVRIHNSPTAIQYGGSNAAANQFLSDNLIFRQMQLPLIIDSLFQTKNTRQIETIINNTRLLPQTTFLYMIHKEIF